MRVFVKSKAAIILLIVLVGAGMSVSAQTTLTMAAPDVLAGIISSKAEIERFMILATPSSLAAAQDGLLQSKVIPEDDKRAMLEILRGLSMLLYPPSEGAPSFFINTSLKNIQPAYSVCLSQLVEATQGRIFAAPKISEGSFLTQLLPALAVFTTNDKETARTALAYAQRFESSGGM